MTRAVFIFGLCLTVVGVVMGDDFAWLPATIVPTVAQQCISFGYAGVCSNGVSLDTPAVCGGVTCALRLPAETVYVSRTMAIANGTICGILNACKKQACTRVPIAKFPRRVGSTVSFPCQVGDPDSDKENVEPPNPNRQGAQSLPTVPLK